MGVVLPDHLVEFARALAAQVARGLDGAKVEDILFYTYLCTLGVLGDEMDKVQVIRGRKGVSKKLPPPEPIAEEILMCVRESLKRGRPVVEKYDYYALA
ncbi:hypothetical protein [Thermoproteus tenax]|uniref:Uncharacterized protein n=1 Tax=Thermoproteus tenax (strain ATCC 35583 / DSM 2078 / JCM 9277 / NBRC 100435 / Kra 1) TaxID=768679 RepID=G4RNS4_THETK|nr:hypothetical protein TTX_0553 [Thermoproteus tenax Kra 1]